MFDNFEKTGGQDQSEETLKVALLSYCCALGIAECGLIEC